MEPIKQKHTHIISVVNQKGGVGKTTTAINLATALAAIYKRVLIIDLDPQGNASTAFGVEPEQRETNIFDVLVDGNVAIKDAVIATSIPNLSIVPATVDLSAAEVQLISIVGREFILKEKIQKVYGKYDYVIIDCPPSLGLLTINALVSSHSIIIPIQCEFFALEGMTHLLQTVELVTKSLNPALQIHGIVLTMYDRRNKLTEQVEEEVRQFMGDKVYKTVIPRNVRVSEAPSHGKPALIYDIKCSGSMAYIALAKEVLAREKTPA